MKRILILIPILLLILNIYPLFSQNTGRIPTIAYKQKGLWHVLDQNGKDIYKPLNLVDITGFGEGYFTVRKAFGKDTAFGFLRIDGKFAIIEGAKYLGVFKNGFAHFATWKKGTEEMKYYGYVRNDGVQIVPPKYLEATLFGPDGLAYVMNWEKRGYIDTTGKFVKVFTQGFGEIFSEGRAVVQDSAGRFGYIDKNFEQAIPLIYDEASNFSEGFARVNKNSYFGFIDSTGLDFIPHVFVLATDFKGGRAFVAKPASVDSLRWAILSKGGKLVTEYIYDQVYDYSQGLAAVKEKGKWFYVDIWGNKYMDKDWKTCESFVDGIAWATELGKKGKRGCIDVSGNFIFTIPNDSESIIDLRLNKVVE
jgi:hypothetical protein